jgi:hypothetical protein
MDRGDSDLIIMRLLNCYVLFYFGVRICMTYIIICMLVMFY